MASSPVPQGRLTGYLWSKELKIMQRYSQRSLIAATIGSDHESLYESDQIQL